MRKTFIAFWGIIFSVVRLVYAQDTNSQLNATALLGLIQFHDKNTNILDQAGLESEVKRRGLGFVFNTEFILNLAKDTNFTDANIEEISDFLQKLTPNTAASTMTTFSLAAETALSVNSTNITALSTNLSPIEASLPTIATNLAAAGMNLSALGTNIDALQTNAPTLGKNITAFGTSLNDFGIKLADLTTNSPSLPYTVFLSSGARFQSLSSVNVQSPTSATLGTAGNTTAGFLEFTYLNRFVLRPNTPADDHIEYFPFLKHLPDVEFHGGFSFANSTGSSNYTASAIAGGGDFYSDLAVGLPLFRYASPSQAHQISLELSGGGVTEKAFLAVHPEFFGGLGYQTSFKPPGLLSSTNLCGFLSVRGGAGYIDTPNITDTTTNITVDMKGGLPQFHQVWAPSMGVEFEYPITGNIYLTVNADVYFKDSPAPWNISVGASIPLSNFNNVFKSFLGN
jgi:hypothetical protein